MVVVDNNIRSCSWMVFVQIDLLAWDVTLLIPTIYLALRTEQIQVGAVQ